MFPAPLRHLALAFALLLVLPGARGAIGGGDTTLPADIAYTGYRLHVRGVELLKEKRGRFLVRCEVANTGRRPVAMGPGFPARFLQTVFDESLAAGGLLRLGLPLRAALVDSRERFAVGEWRRELEFWLDPEADLAGPELSTDDFARRRAGPRRVRPDPDDGNDDAVASAGAPAEVPGVSADAEPACADLAVTAMRVVIRDRETATLRLTVTNLGEGSLAPADLPEGIPLDVFLGGAPEISGSSRRVGGVDLTERLRAADGLDPGESLTLVERVDTRAATRYTGVLTARIDGSQALRECEETNNEASVLLEG